MKETWLFLDCSFLCYRARYSTGELSFEGQPTGVIFGFLRDVLNFQESHATNHIAFCWDKGKSLRSEILPSYKGNRIQTPLSKDEILTSQKFKQQVVLLRDFILTDIGFRNNFAVDGYEGDDLIGSLCQNSLPIKSQAIIIAADHDFYQLLDGERVILWNPITKKAYTEDALREEYDVTPPQWREVKALAGCKGDNVPGIAGVGETIAARYLTGKLGARSKKIEKIKDMDSQKLFTKNMSLVSLPLKGTPVLKLQEDHASPKRWQAVLKCWGLDSLLNRAPSYC